METGILQTVTQYAEEIHGEEGFRYISAVVANCKMLAIQLEEQEEQNSEDEGKEFGSLEDSSKKEGEIECENSPNDLDMDALIIAAYLHDISTATYGYYDHQIKSAELAVEFLRELDMPEGCVRKVEQAILAHTTTVSSEESEAIPLEGRILYDADKLGRLSGLAIVTSLIEFGTHYPNQALTGEVLAAVLRHIEERYVELYQSLHTTPAREMAREKFGNTLAFLDGVIEHLSDATPV